MVQYTSELASESIHSHIFFSIILGKNSNIVLKFTKFIYCSHTPFTPRIVSQFFPNSYWEKFLAHSSYFLEIMYKNRIPCFFYVLGISHDVTKE